MSKVFNGKVSVVRNTKGEIALRRDENGKFSAANAAELLDAMHSLAKRYKLKVSPYALFVPEGGKVPVLLTNRYGQPYLAVLPPDNGGKRAKARVEKLA